MGAAAPSRFTAGHSSVWAMLRCSAAAAPPLRLCRRMLLWSRATKEVQPPLLCCRGAQCSLQLALSLLCRAVKKVQPVLGGFDKSKYQTERLWATAPDGVKVTCGSMLGKHALYRCCTPLHHSADRRCHHAHVAVHSCSCFTLGTLRCDAVRRCPSAWCTARIWPSWTAATPCCWTREWGQQEGALGPCPCTGGLAGGAGSRGHRRWHPSTAVHGSQ